MSISAVIRNHKTILFCTKCRTKKELIGKADIVTESRKLGLLHLNCKKVTNDSPKSKEVSTK